MKPIIIGLNKEGKVDLTLEDFKAFMDKAYYEGYTDGCSYSSTISTINNDSGHKWWARLPTTSTFRLSTAAIIHTEG